MPSGAKVVRPTNPPCLFMDQIGRNKSRFIFVYNKNDDFFGTLNT